MQSDKSLLLRWCIWFFLGNALIYCLIGLNYLQTIPWLDSIYFTPHGLSLLKTFMTLAYLGQLGLLALIPCVVIVPLIFIFPKRHFILIISVVISTALALLLMIDTLTYKLYHFHLNGVMFDLALNGFSQEVFGFSVLEYSVAAAMLGFLLLLESSYAYFLWRKCVNNNIYKNFLKWPVIIIILSLYTSYGMIIYSDKQIVHRVFADMMRVLPFYTEMFGVILPKQDGLNELDRLAESYLTQPRKASAPLNYPLTPLLNKPAKKPFNIVMIVIDAWRFDMLNAQVTPNLKKFAEQSQIFSQHSSGGNATGPGIFSLFYGLPITYWTAMEVQHRGPLLLDELTKQHYKMGIFSSSGIYLPAFYRTVFQSIKGLSLYPQPGNNPYQRDQMVTRKFMEFVNGKMPTSQPFFSFLFYDTVHSYCAFNVRGPLRPAVKHCNRMQLTNQSDPVPYLNRYKNAVILVDQQIQTVLATLKKRHLLENTIVIVTGDHGEEFNDNQLGFWGHASNFTHSQTATPLIVYWPGKKPAIYAHSTSHFDVAPTLMKAALGVETQPSSYCLGKDLFDLANPLPYLIIGSYTAFGIVEPDHITYVSPVGSYQVEQLNGRPSPGIKLNERTLHLVFQDLRRFYQK